MEISVSFSKREMLCGSWDTDDGSLEETVCLSGAPSRSVQILGYDKVCIISIDTVKIYKYSAMLGARRKT